MEKMLQGCAWLKGLTRDHKAFLSTCRLAADPLCFVSSGMSQRNDNLVITGGMGLAGCTVQT